MATALAKVEAMPPRVIARGGGATGDAIFFQVARAFGVLVLLLLGAIVLMLFIGGLPAFRAFGFDFLWTAAWNPVRERFGAAVSIYGTIATAVLALLLAVPLAFGIAFFLTELAPPWLRRPIGILVELLAAVPSIVYGMWGFFVLVPILARIEPVIVDALGGIPLIGVFFGGPATGAGILTAAVVLAIMVLPFIAATVRDVFDATPAMLKESAYGLGATTMEVMWRVVLPYGRAGVIGGIMLGLGRALGETMAVTFVIGNANRISPSIFAPGNTIASVIALEFPEAELGSLKIAALIALGFVLVVMSLIVLALSRWLLRPRVGQ